MYTYTYIYIYIHIYIYIVHMYMCTYTHTFLPWLLLPRVRVTRLHCVVVTNETWALAVDPGPVELVMH